MIIDVIVGARPNFMKVAALFAVSAGFPSLFLRLIHTGQHYDAIMSDVFLQQLGLPQPAHHLGVGSDTHARQTAKIMEGYESWLQHNPADMCLVVGDVNSTVACALVAAKAGMRVTHVEAGLRSFDRTMPEEINRIVTDSISDLLFVTEPAGVINLAHEGHPASKIHLVGHVMIDTLLRMKPQAEALESYRQFDIESGGYAYLTLHRPSNVDHPAPLAAIGEQLRWLADLIPVIFPVHPRTRAQIAAFGLQALFSSNPNLKVVEPLGYLESLSVMLNSQLVITDSGGVQEETTALGIPCLTLRENTERPITIQAGTNRLIGHDWQLFRQSVQEILRNEYKPSLSAIPYWDGLAGTRILKIISQGLP